MNDFAILKQSSGFDNTVSLLDVGDVSLYFMDDIDHLLGEV